MDLKYKVTGDRRKALVSALGEILGWEPKYAGAPTFSYIVGNYTVDKDGTIACPTSAIPEIIDQLIENLKQRGFELVDKEYDTLVVELPRNLYDDRALNRMRNLISSKSKVLMKALDATSLPVLIEEDKIKFPWFKLHGIEGEAKAYGHLICSMADLAKNLHYASEVERDCGDNYRYAMRMFLIRLGFNGEQYKAERKILLRNLPGNCSWKDASKAKKPKAKADLPLASEATNNEGSENELRIPSKEELESIRSRYPKGARVEVVQINDPYANLAPGEKGTINFVDDLGTIFVNWDCGSTLGVVLGEDQIRIIG